jgi:hypothetical protein
MRQRGEMSIQAQSTWKWSDHMKRNISNVSNNVPLVLTDGTEGAAFFFAGNGIAITRQGEMVGELSQAKLDDLAQVDEAGEHVANRVAQFLTPHELTAESRRTLALSATEWIETHSL